MSTDTTTDTGTKVCTGCNTEKPLDDFRKDAKGKQGRQAKCKDCKSGKVTEPAPADQHASTDMLEAAITAGEQYAGDVAAKDGTTPAAAKKPTRTAFYLNVITDPMTQLAVESALKRAGWADEGSRKVAATLQYLARSGKLTVDDVTGLKIYTRRTV